MDAQVADPFPGVEDDSAEHAESGDRDEHQGEHRGQGVQHGLEATRRILTGASDPPRVIILTTSDLDDLVYAALSAGASGFLLKDVTPEHLVSAVRLVRSGDALLAEATVKTHVARILAKLGLRDRVQAVVAAYETGLVTPSTVARST
ncbi:MULTISPECIES: response regulator [unclassified Streptomyces]|uniref:response regulator n=1 Tax=unclassified Streptomyces TaxID=2593676 RepID=UPI00359C8BF3